MQGTHYYQRQCARCGLPEVGSEAGRAVHLPAQPRAIPAQRGQRPSSNVRVPQQPQLHRGGHHRPGGAVRVRALIHQQRHPRDRLPDLRDNPGHDTPQVHHVMNFSGLVTIWTNMERCWVGEPLVSYCMFQTT